MLFTTATFVLLFLPIVLGGYFLLGLRWHGAALAWMFAASVFFYGWWMPAFTLLLLFSIAVNFALGGAIARSRAGPGPSGAGPRTKALMLAGVAFNLGLLAYFKYANFFVDNLNAALGTDWRLGAIVLPIGISFYSFTQIAFLVDTAQGKVAEFRATHYGLFVSYFPHLVAGPVLHHAQMMPQFAQRDVCRFQGGNFAAGLVIFAAGLLKKVVLADGVAPYADAVFNPADAGQLPTLAEGWLGAMAYTLQLYFDFSGYSDMAIGLSWMFNVRLPFNFDSPYRAANISDFWRRWHMTLSAFLRDYLYIALGGNRKGPVRRYLNLAATMVLGGLWHGASWSFVLWGALHGTYLMINHGFRAWCTKAGWAEALDRSRVFSLVAWALTMAAVIAAWVFFRAHSHDGALRVLAAMVGAGTRGTDTLLWNAGLSLPVGTLWCVVLGAIALLPYNSNRLGETVRNALAEPRPLRLALGTVATVLGLFLVLVNTARDSVSAFIYFNF